MYCAGAVERTGVAVGLDLLDDRSMTAGTVILEMMGGGRVLE